MHFGQMHFGGWWYEIISNRYKIDLMVKEKRRRKRKTENIKQLYYSWNYNI